mmetsp:Transcript_65507/g.156561  ORF Transcript_65507/g.156561 Transcript_65507/m.156561 type:complete len:221 (-) Transcript_65507:1132-1794(-)
MVHHRPPRDAAGLPLGVVRVAEESGTGGHQPLLRHRHRGFGAHQHRDAGAPNQPPWPGPRLRAHRDLGELRHAGGLYAGGLLAALRLQEGLLLLGLEPLRLLCADLGLVPADLGLRPGRGGPPGRAAADLAGGEGLASAADHPHFAPLPRALHHALRLLLGAEGHRMGGSPAAAHAADLGHCGCRDDSSTEPGDCADWDLPRLRALSAGLSDCLGIGAHL